MPSAQGDYSTYYEEFAHAVHHGGSGPVTAADGIRTFAVLDAARRSAAEAIVVPL